MPPARVVAVLRVLLALAFTALLMAQLRAVPALYDDWLREAPAGATPERWPVLVVAWLVLLCIQTVIVCIWRLLTMVTHDRIFTEASLGWVDAILWAITAAWTLLLSVFVYAVGPLEVAAGPAVALLLLLVVGAVVALLMLVMPALLRQATTLRSDLEAVI